MARYAIEDEALASKIRKALKLAEDTEIFVSTPGKTKDPRPCECGCGEETKGGEFVAGHDSTLKSAVYAAIRGETPKAEHLAGLTKAQAEKILADREWPAPVERPAKKVKEPKAEGEEKPKRSRGKAADTTAVPAEDAA